MWAVLCHDTDTAAVWAAVGLRRLGVVPVELVLAQELAIGARLVHSVSSGEATAWLRLRDGRELRGDALGGVLNRLVSVPAGDPSLPERDRDYAAAERTAATASWLAGLRCPVLNPPSGACICARTRRDPEWQQMAVAAGLTASGWSLSTRTAKAAFGSGPDRPVARVVLVAGDTVARSPDPAIDDGLVAMAALGRTPLLEVELAEGPGGWAVGGASQFPDFPRFGSEGLAALARALGAVQVVGGLA